MSVFGCALAQRAFPPITPIKIHDLEWKLMSIAAEDVAPEIMEEAFAAYAKQAEKELLRWGVVLDFPDDAPLSTRVDILRSSVMVASEKALSFPLPDFYPDDHGWNQSGIRGLSRARMIEDSKPDPYASSGEEWGICARVVCSGTIFDVPIAIDLDEESCRRFMERMDGLESIFVDIPRVIDALGASDVEIQLHCGNWAAMREISNKTDLSLADAIIFRRPAIWDLMRARESGLGAEPLRRFDEEEFHTRLLRSARFDEVRMHSNKAMLRSLSSMRFDFMSHKWVSWFPTVIETMQSIGAPGSFEGMSVLLNFVVEEPGAEETASWVPVASHNLIVAYGLHPLSAAPLLDLVRSDPTPFYDLPEQPLKRYRLLGASVIQDTMLSSFGASANGRTDAYDIMADQVD